MRDRLTREIFVTFDPRDATGVLEAALVKVAATEDAERKIERAVREGKIHRYLGNDWLAEAQGKGVITLDEAADLREAEALVAKVIAVDHFDADEITGRSAIGHNSRPAQAFEQPPHAAPQPGQAFDAPPPVVTRGAVPAGAAVMASQPPRPASSPDPKEDEEAPVEPSTPTLVPPPIPPAMEPDPEPVIPVPERDAQGSGAAYGEPGDHPVAHGPPIRPSGDAAPAPQSWGAPSELSQPASSVEPVSSSVAPPEPARQPPEPVRQSPEQGPEPAGPSGEEPPHRTGEGIHPAE